MQIYKYLRGANGMNLSGKVAIITGASKGIGRAITFELTKAGASVVINYKSDKEGAEETLAEVKAMGGYGQIICADVSIYSEVESLIEKVENIFGKIDILVNNAGMSKVGLFSEMSEKDFDEIVNTNLKGTFNCCHIAVKNMLKRKSGCIINISSIWGNVGASCEVIYSASKGGINSFTKALAKELGPSAIRVNAIAPGVIDTSMNKWLTKEEKDNITNEIPLQKFGEGEDIGKLVVYLSSSESKYVTGQIITVDGGLT